MLEVALGPAVAQKGQHFSFQAVPWHPPDSATVKSPGAASGEAILPSFAEAPCCGEHQFAYQPGKGSQDAILYMVLTWLEGFRRKCKFAFYCSDVSGAFDRVDHHRLLDKLAAMHVPSALLNIIKAWLDDRVATIIVNGENSTQLALKDMLFQGTVLGPTLWNAFYNDSAKAVRSSDFREIVFADDLNSHKEYPNSAPLPQLLQDMKNCQTSLHAWGRANSVAFDPSKESMHVISRSQPHGSNFKLLGIDFDTSLIMDQAIHNLVVNCRWKRNMLMRSGRFLTGQQLIALYKSQLLGYIEYRTPAIYHANDSLLAPLNDIQTQILEAASMNPLEALMVANLAPLTARRDMAMLGAIHRSVLRRGPVQFDAFFQRSHVDVPGRHRLQLQEWQEGDCTDYMLPGSAPAQYIARSVLGLVTIYNRLPAEIVDGSTTVKDFQSRLQHFMKQRACEGDERWGCIFSPRWALHTHPLTV